MITLNKIYQLHVNPIIFTRVRVLEDDRQQTDDAEIADMQIEVINTIKTLKYLENG